MSTVRPPSSLTHLALPQASPALKLTTLAPLLFRTEPHLFPIQPTFHDALVWSFSSPLLRAFPGTSMSTRETPLLSDTPSLASSISRSQADSSRPSPLPAEPHLFPIQRTFHDALVRSFSSPVHRAFPGRNIDYRETPPPLSHIQPHPALKLTSLAPLVFRTEPHLFPIQPTFHAALVWSFSSPLLWAFPGKNMSTVRTPLLSHTPSLTSSTSHSRRTRQRRRHLSPRDSRA